MVNKPVENKGEHCVTQSAITQKEQRKYLSSSKEIRKLKHRIDMYLKTKTQFSIMQLDIYSFLSNERRRGFIIKVH